MSFLTEPEVTIIVYNGCRFRINPAFDTVLEIQNLFREDTLSDADKLEQALKMLVLNKEKLIHLDWGQKAELLNEIYSNCINMTKDRPAVKKDIPVVDFEYDGEYIYASFMLDYRIDLIREQGKLPWRKFIALFQGLSENTKIREVMKIREMKIPAYNGKNSGEIQQIQQLKSYYALPVRGGGGPAGLNALFSTLERMAVKN